MNFLTVLIHIYNEFDFLNTITTVTNLAISLITIIKVVKVVRLVEFKTLFESDFYAFNIS